MEVTLTHGLSNGGNPKDLGWPPKCDEIMTSFTHCKYLQIEFFVYKLTVVQQMATSFQLTWRVTRFLCESWSLCWRAYILPLWFRLSSFFFSTPNFWGHWTDLNQTWIHIHLWLLFEKFDPNSPAIYLHGLGAKTLLGPILDSDRTYLCNGTWYQQ